MTAILGISAFFHDSAAALVVDGEIIAAAQEERFSRRKHDADFPAAAIASCLDAAGLTPGELDFVGFYEKPLLKFDRLLETHLAFAPRGFWSFAQAMPVWLKEKLHLPRVLRRHLPEYRRRFVFTEHHESHAASAFFPSPFERAAILTVDGVGEWATASIGIGEGNRIRLIQELRFPHSLGLLYSAFTTYCGFRVNSGEAKLMGLAPYGQPRYADPIREKLLDLKADGSFRLNLSYFSYCHGQAMTSRKFHRLFGGPPRKPESELTDHQADLAASIQEVTEEILLRMVRHVHQTTGLKHLCLAGGVALNCVANGRIYREGPFDDLWVQPAAGDAGGALGVALYIWHHLLRQPRTPQPSDSQRGSLLGPEFTTADVQTVLDRAGAVYRHLPDEAALLNRVADLIAAEQVVGWFQGRMEFGPRALGTRSILADARSERMQSILNTKTKRRESFRPFAPSVLADRADEFFDLPDGSASPYMLLVAKLRSDKRRPLSPDQQALSGLELWSAPQSVVPAVTHVDGSARVQTVDPKRHSRYYRLLEVFAAKTGTPLVVNTSFNVRGEPLVCTPEDAWRCFVGTDMDALVIEDFLILKNEQPADVLQRCERPSFAPD